jgi:hypothetical protein
MEVMSRRLHAGKFKELQNTLSNLAFVDRGVASIYYPDNDAYMPAIVNGAVLLTENYNRSTLENLPVYVGGGLTLKNAVSVMSLVGSPLYVGAELLIENTSIENLKGGPNYVGHGYRIGRNEKLLSLEGINPEASTVMLFFNNPSLTLEHLPKNLRHLECDAIPFIKGIRDGSLKNLTVSENLFLYITKKELSKLSSEDKDILAPGKYSTYDNLRELIQPNSTPSKRASRSVLALPYINVSAPFGHND